jgi:predicted permease
VLVTSTVGGQRLPADGDVLRAGRHGGRRHGLAATRALRLDRAAASAFLLVVVCSNSGNYGLPVTLLAFGREALAYASVYFVASSIFSYTGGVLLAASGERGRRRRCAACCGCRRSTARWPRPWLWRST